MEEQTYDSGWQDCRAAVCDEFVPSPVYRGMCAAR